MRHTRSCNPKAQKKQENKTKKTCARRTERNKYLLWLGPQMAALQIR